MNHDIRLQSINAELLTKQVHQALGVADAAVTEWSFEPIQDGLSGFAVTRLRGTAQTADGPKPWSLILKVLDPSSGGQVEEDFHYWRREALLYQSELLNDLPELLRVPRCFTVTEIQASDEAGQSTHEFWLWLEDMGQDETAWALERYGLAARHLGQMNGAYLVGKPLPQATWLRRPDVDERLALAEEGILQLAGLQEHPLFAELFFEGRVERIAHLWNSRGRLLDSLNRLPQTFCHRDAGRLNLMAGCSTDSSDQTTALDWGSAGIGMLGEEIVPLFAASLAFVEIDLARLPELERLIFEGYVAGLRDAGWSGDERMVRFGFTALAALKRGVADPGYKIPRIAKRAAALPPDVEPPKLLDAGGVRQANAVNQHLLKLGEEALRLVDQI